MEDPKMIRLGNYYQEGDLQLIANCLMDQFRALQSQVIYCPTGSPEHKELTQKRVAISFFLTDLERLGIKPEGSR
ncbi:hypothetical protein [Microbulbifer sp. SAOS-129_SWC]|uniref:hypothetical protein n=1 Tax=Microbulbifer sp. SAOS-129_SWC TaxID=3145235 RepID=UPI003217093E